MEFLSQIPEPFPKAWSGGEDLLTSTLTISCNSNQVAVVNGYFDKDVEGQLYTTRYFNFYGVRETIQQYMEEQEISNTAFTFHFEGFADGGVKEADYSFTPSYLYCKDVVHNISADTFTANNFLTSAPFTFASLDRNPIRRIRFTNEVGANLYQVTTYRDSYGTIRTLSRTVQLTNPIMFALADTPQYDADQIISIQFNLRDRSYTIYAHQGDHQLFRFVNRWNVQEELLLECGVIRQPESSYEEAMIGDICMHYDIENTIQHEVSTPSLFPQLRETVMQFLRSRKVEHYVPGIGYKEILIKDYTFENADTTNTPLVLEMTFEYADRREFTTLGYVPVTQLAE